MLKFTLYLNLYFGIIAAFTNLETIPNNYLETFKYQNNVYYNTKNLELSDFENSNINIIPVIFVYNLLKHPYLNETLYRIDIESTKRILLDNGYTNDQLYEIIIDERFPNEFLLGYTGCKDVMKINKLISILTNEFGYDSVNIVVDSLSGVLVDRAVSGEYLESFGESCYPGEPILKKINSIISFPLLNHGLFTCNIPPSFLFEIYNDKVYFKI
ncbi:Lipase EstA/Esterase EstB family-containing protein [Strongyloides ratti]|uniref:Lipase EstA/Esterase EstB family-containing protein n=1 Tax=Strongyloides ratti TaxID=34506 RepID=A0A090MQ15_STRRB|nr:Lipase EstA/Esterase EstB family-containing protein [Strongyloides ratti]CEF60212.1 Lipase EstA/Esterase EstB family-containing protein [Strongyloides ratti]